MAPATDAVLVLNAGSSNVARSGKFSSDPMIAEYARDIWRATECPVG